ncbi:MAG: hypothetical protein AABX19_00260 [Nanoarchaeota archaeon]
MVERAGVSKKRYFLAFLLATGIFSIGLLLGITLTSAKLSEVEKLQIEFRNRLTNLEMEDLLTEGKICQFSDVDNLVDELSKIGETLTSIENDPSTNHDDILALKEYYSLLEIRHMIYMQKFNEQCGKKLDIVLYFYSNDEEKCIDCSSQGYILSYIRNKYSNVRIYSYDIDIDNPAIRTLMKLNNVTAAPSLIINDEFYSGYQDKKLIEEKISS